MLLQLGADIVYAGLTTYVGYSGGLLDLGWMVSYLCWGAAAPHPSVRYGGEEFTALLLGCSQIEAVAILDRVRAATPLGETVSIGVAQWDGQQSPEQLIGVADEALYQAEHQGRNRVVAAPPPAARSDGDRSPSPVRIS